MNRLCSFYFCFVYFGNDFIRFLSINFGNLILHRKYVNVIPFICRLMAKPCLDMLVIVSHKKFGVLDVGVALLIHTDAVKGGQSFLCVCVFQVCVWMCEKVRP
ncbi:hypothetical protein AMECASPLE_007729 [Ameca splendens]|uniref:Secreted protein n=1 Tax=Ameca splendens TaxID=208324 RepID=A0ABV0YAW2_9TELE